MSTTPKTQKFTLKRIIENLGNIPAKGFNEETPKLSAEQKRKLMEMASMFEQYGEAIKNEEAVMNSAKALSELCELAESYAVNECGDWFQQEIVTKDMKELKKRVMEYGKVAKECYSRMQQLGVAHQDIGHILGRYYDLKRTTPAAQPADASAEKQTLQNEGNLPPRPDWCPSCGGTGKEKSTSRFNLPPKPGQPATPPKNCPKCGGSGKEFRRNK